MVAVDEPPKQAIPLMSEQQWDRLYRKVERIKQPSRRWENLAWASVGLLVTAAFGLAAWWLGNDEAGRAGDSWQGWIYGFGTFLALVLLSLSVMAQRGQTDQLSRDKNDALEEMCDFHTPASLTEPPEATQ